MISPHSVALMRRQKSGGSIEKNRRIAVSESGAPSATAVRAAEKLVVAARENVRFLNRHLRKYRVCLELPQSVDNVLYLAYTVRVRDTAPFTADKLRRHLDYSGIETMPSFSFDGAEDGRRVHDPSVFCIACHQYLTISDLEYIVETFEAFLESTSSDTTAKDRRK